MCKSYKYDIAFSFAEADRPVAEQIHQELKLYNIEVYFYSDKDALQWGIPIITLTLDAYTNAKFILTLTSAAFKNAYWGNIEKIVSLANKKKNAPRVLQLRLDDTSIDGLSKDVVYRQWENNPREIASLLAEMVTIENHKYRKKRFWILFTSLFVFITTLLFYFLHYLPQLSPGSYPQRSVRPVAIMATYIQASDQAAFTSPAFYISETEVTVKQYRDYCDSTHQQLPPQPWPVYNNNPVVNITWSEAQRFCKWQGGRLPSEQEWENAASASLLTRYSGGDNAEQVAVYKRKHFKPVATKSKNALGLYDMSGNVAEWCNNSTDASGNWKLIKGGSHKDGITELAIHSRSKEFYNARKPYIGFRVAWDRKPIK